MRRRLAARPPLLRRLILERSLPGAGVRGELDLRFQAICDLDDRRTVGVEAQLRWRHPKLGWVAGAELAAIAHEVGAGAELGAWVRRRACRQLAGWLAEGRDLWMSINVAVPELESATYVTAVAAALTEYGAPPARLVVEIADPGSSADPRRVASQLAGLRALGVRVALDEFDLCHASMRQLHRLPVDLLKMADGGHAVVAAFGRRLGYEVIALDIADEAGAVAARNGGCRYGQGVHLGRPAPAEHIEALLGYSAVQPGIG